MLYAKHLVESDVPSSALESSDSSNSFNLDLTLPCSFVIQCTKKWRLIAWTNDWAYSCVYCVSFACSYLKWLVTTASFFKIKEIVFLDTLCIYTCLYIYSLYVGRYTHVFDYMLVVKLLCMLVLCFYIHLCIHVCPRCCVCYTIESVKTE